MALFEIKAIEAELVEVDYLGGTVLVPEGHQFVAMTKLDCSNGETKGLLVSYEVEPTVSRNGYYVAVPGTEHRILGEVEYRDPRGSLRRVAGHSRDKAILANAEELAYKLVAGLQSGEDIHTIIHDLFCPECGEFAGFMHTTVPMLKEYFEEVEAENTAAEEAADEPQVHVINASNQEVPEELKGLLGLLGLLAFADGAGRA